MRAIAHTSCRQYVPIIHLFVWHAVDDYTTASSSYEVCRFAQEHPSGMKCPTPVRLEIKVLLTVCIAVVVGGLGRVAPARLIAP